jgi:hypothetical protein
MSGEREGGREALAPEEEEEAIAAFLERGRRMLRLCWRLQVCAAASPPDYPEIQRASEKERRGGGLLGEEDIREISELAALKRSASLGALFAEWEKEIRRKLSFEEITRRLARVMELQRRWLKGREAGETVEAETRAVLEEIEAAERLIHQEEEEELFSEDLLHLDGLRNAVSLPLLELLGDIRETFSNLERMLDGGRSEGGPDPGRVDEARALVGRAVELYETALLLDHPALPEVARRFLEDLREDGESWRNLGDLLGNDDEWSGSHRDR